MKYIITTVVIYLPGALSPNAIYNIPFDASLKHSMEIDQAIKKPQPSSVTFHADLSRLTRTKEKLASILDLLAKKSISL